MLIVLAEPMVRLLFERGAFTADSTERASFALMCLAPGLLTYSAVNVMARAFYAMGDTKVPMQISAVCLGLNLIIVVPMIFTFPKGQQAGALGVANVASSLVNVALLSYALETEDAQVAVRPANQAAGWHAAHGRRRRGARLDFALGMGGAAGD